MLRNTLRSVLAFFSLFSSSLAAAQTSFVAFESGHVRPVTLSQDGSQLFAVNTPDNTLEIFDVTGGGLSFAASVPVGMEPVSAAARTNDEVWVVNHLSDSISIVDVSGAVPIVARTLLLGDEPRDIVFAGPSGNRAFITTAHRGQHRTHSSISGVFGGGNPADPRFTTEGIDRADVWVFDATSLGTTIGGTPIDPRVDYTIAVEHGASVDEELSGARVRDTGIRVRDLIGKHIRTSGSVKGVVDGRIQRR